LATTLFTPVNLQKDICMTAVAAQDSRNYFLLPQTPEESSYYTYGTPGRGAAQYAHAKMLTFIFLLDFHWGEVDERKIGIGNISLAGGVKFPPHRGHRTGLEADIRPMRKGGERLPVRFTDSQYDRQATQKLVDSIWRTGMVRRVIFNDVLIPRVQRMIGHDDHLHVEVIG